MDFFLWKLPVENLHILHQSNEILHIFVELFICKGCAPGSNFLHFHAVSEENWPRYFIGAPALSLQFPIGDS